MDCMNSSRRLLRSPYRLLLAGLGIVCVGLGLVGIVVPGMPTTIFLILASYLFTRSCPVLEEKLLGIRPLRPYARFVSGGCPIPKKARWTALAMMWVAVTLSLAVLASREVLGLALLVLLVGAACAGSAMILRYRSTTS